MSYSQMRGQSILIGSTIGEGVLKFSDGTKQYTAYPGTLTDGLTPITKGALPKIPIGAKSRIGSNVRLLLKLAPTVSWSLVTNNV